MRPTGRSLILAAGLLLAASQTFAERRLNNLVTELVAVDAQAAKEYHFRLPRDGWIFVRALDGAPPASIHVDGQTVITYGAGESGVKESMRFLPAGDHTVVLVAGAVGQLQVRSIPEIRFCKYQYDPWVVAFGPYDWNYLEAHILPHINSLVGMIHEDQSQEAERWRGRGKQWIVEVPAPGVRKGESPGAAEIVEKISSDGNLAAAWVDGVVVDEYLTRMTNVFSPTVDAIEQITNDVRYRGKRIDPYVAGDPVKLAGLIKGVTALGGKLAVERYNCEQPNEPAARRYLKEKLTDHIKAWRGIIDRPQDHMIVCLGMLAGPPESLNAYPHVNYRKFQDMEFNILANDPEFDGLFGVMQYTCGYAEDEVVRWVGQLFRHYCIEGNTEPRTAEPYLLGHLQNPDFEEGTSGWEISPAEQGSIEVRKFEKLGSLQARYGSGAAGDQCLVMTRSATGPNVVRQPMVDLVPGRLYALRMYSSNLIHRDVGYGNPVFDDYTTIDIDIDGGEMLDEKCFDHLYRSIHTNGLMYFNYHFRIFRAAGTSAVLRISDWAASDRRLGNVGRETGINFVEIQQYLE